MHNVCSEAPRDRLILRTKMTVPHNADAVRRRLCCDVNVNINVNATCMIKLGGEALWHCHSHLSYGFTFEWCSVAVAVSRVDRRKKVLYVLSDYKYLHKGVTVCSRKEAGNERPALEFVNMCVAIAFVWECICYIWKDRWVDSYK